MKPTISIIGMGDGGQKNLSVRALNEVQSAELLVGGKRLLSAFPESKAERLVLGKDLAPAIQAIQREAACKRTVVLLSGDPFFFGMGRLLIQSLPKFHLEFFPYPSSIQLAFSRIGENWDDAHLTSVHAGDLRSLLPLLRAHDKIGILTDRSNSPGKIATLVLDSVGEAFTCFVCENLEGEKERVTRGTLKKIRGMEFSPLNVVILLRKKKKGALFPLVGVPDEQFRRRPGQGGLITKAEVRAISLSKMEIRPDSIVWDVGAGSGSVSIEAASLATRGRVYAVEKNPEDLRVIRKNIWKFSMPHVIPILGSAPECFPEIKEDPDVLFVGGSGGKMEEILAAGLARLRPGGRFVVNLVALENLHRAAAILKKMRLNPEILSVSISRSRGIGGLTRLENLNPVFVVYGKKG